MALAASLCAPGPVLAQSAPVVSRPVVQALPNRDSVRLNAALTRLARDPRDASALIEAGEAANAMGDADAAVGFFRRADQISPGNAKVKAGLAGATVLNGNPIDAITLFQQAEQAGATSGEIASDRGLAYDLVGDNLTAQKYYKTALGGADDDEVRRRLSLSQAIAGDAKGAEATLMPLLRKQDKPGWRTRAFTLAIAGDVKQAVQVAGTILPGPLAESISPYLRYMPRLTPAQQAAAANLGKFPRASEIGHDDPRIAEYVARLGPRPSVAAADAGLIPQGKPLGKDSKAKANAATTRASREAAAKATRLAKAETPRIAPPEPKPSIVRDNSGELPPVAASPGPVQTLAARTTPTPAPTPTPGPTPAPKPAPEPARSTLASSTPASTSTPTSTPTPAPATASTQRVALADVPPRTATPTPSPAPTPTPAPASAPSQTLAAATAGPPAGPSHPGFDLAALPNSQASAPSTSTPEPSPADILDAATSGRPVPPPSAATRAVELAEAQTPPASTAVTQPVPQTVSLADAFADLGAPSVQSAPVSGAVDISKIEPAKPEPKPDPKEVAREAEAKSAEAKAVADKKLADKKLADKKAAEKKAAEKKPAHPSRIWVQLGVGRDKAAIAYDWRKWSKEAPVLFKGRAANVSDMGRTNRILAGPFESAKAANDFVTKLDKAGITGSHVWTSPAGQVVDALAAK